MIKILIKKLSIFFRGSIWKSKPAFSLIHVVKIRKIFNFLALGLTLFGPLFFLFFIKNFLWFFSKNTRYSPWYNIWHYLKKSENFCKHLLKNKKHMVKILQNADSVHTPVYTCVCPCILHFFFFFFCRFSPCVKNFLVLLFFTIYSSIIFSKKSHYRFLHFLQSRLTGRLLSSV